MQKLYTIEFSVSVDEGSTGALQSWLNQFGTATFLCINHAEGDDVPVASFKLLTARPSNFMGNVEKAYREYDEKLKGIYFYTAIYEITHCPEDIDMAELLGLINTQAYTACITRTEVNYLIGQIDAFKNDILMQVNNQSRAIKQAFGGINRLGQEVFGRDMYQLGEASAADIQDDEEQPTKTPEKKQWLH
ncbi:hypothetical protein G646_gp152 [Serratia phage phiMAM1]|uniref:Uncharacterized protein n=2 Tax=Miltonvirus MAM1 TaxID=2169689 RepID=K7YY41_9CAUD|nr:hypothetical protein G646_gp152 [Serratia phage phiMAM1]AFX93620.1 hypothetical protein MAM_152 [Serratia phage phiMAM1]ASZ78930.1 hypothetical protein 2050H1_164 [Serratia phage 2050H1]